MLRKQQNKNVASVPAFGVPKPPPVRRPFADADRRRKKENSGEGEKRSDNALLPNTSGFDGVSPGPVLNSIPETVTPNEEDKDELIRQTIRELLEMDPIFHKKLLDMLEK